MSILRCIEAFAVMEGNVPRVLRFGDSVLDTDPVVKGHESMFEPIENYLDRRESPVEVATAAPGELRQVTKPPPRRRKPPAKKAAGK